MLLKKLFLTLILIFAFSFCVYSADEPSLSAYSAVLLNAETKEIIYEKNAHKQRSMASTTKIMTSILAIESGRLSDVVTAENMAAEGTSIGLKNGYKLTLESLIWGMLLESGNDAAKLTANYLGGSEENFSVLMNDKAEEIGMTNSHFVTASGLDDKDHYSTAYDMALLGAYATRNPVFREICSSKTKKVEFIEPGIIRTFSNHNRLLSMSEGVFGIKTGFTKKSGRCLVSACERDGTTLIAVTLNAGDDWNDHIKLYDYGYDVCQAQEIFVRLPESVCVYGGLACDVSVELETNPISLGFKGEKGSVTQKIYLPKFTYAPIECGDILGKAELFRNGELIYSGNILASGSVAAIEPTLEETNIFKKFFSKITELFN